MPVIGRSDHHRVDLLIVENAPEIVFEARLAALLPGDIGAGFLQHFGIEIAKRLKPSARPDRPQRVAVALIAPADQRQRDFLIRAHRGRIEIDESRGCGGLEKCSTTLHSGRVSRIQDRSDRGIERGIKRPTTRRIAIPPRSVPLAGSGTGVTALMSVVLRSTLAPAPKMRVRRWSTA